MTRRRMINLFCAVFLVTYALSEKLGLFGPPVVSGTDIWYAKPILLASLIFLFGNTVPLLRKTTEVRLSAGMRAAGIFLLVAGLWTGALTRFSFETVLTEGQIFTSNQDMSLATSSYIGKFASPPPFQLRLNSLVPEFNEDKKELLRVSADASYRELDGVEKKIYLSNKGMGFVRGMMVCVRDFGYSPRYVLKSEDGSVADSAFVSLMLFPSGNEDYFRLLFPHTFYLRYYEKQGRDDAYFHLRIARNKDIVFSDMLKLKQDAVFENARLSLEEVRHWTRISVKKDWGEFMMIGGAVLFAAGLLIGFFKRSENK